MLDQQAPNQQVPGGHADPPTDADADTGTATGTAEYNRAAVVAHFAALQRGDVRAALASFAPDLVNHRKEPGSAPGLTGLAQTLAVVLTCFPAAVWRVERVVAEAEDVAAHVVVEGEAHGVIMGVRATGQRVSWRHVHWFRLADGKVVEHDAVRDDRGLLRQLGMTVRGPHPGGLGGGPAGSTPAPHGPADASTPVAQ